MHKFSTASPKALGQTVLRLRRPPQRTIQYACGGRPASGCPRAWRNALRPPLSPLRDENLCIIRASEVPKWVCANQDGGFLNMGSVKRRSYKNVLKEAKMWHTKFHNLRHTFASQLLSKGANILYVSQQLGHADASITLRVYACTSSARIGIVKIL